jgi:hypothetical protein
LLFICGRSKFSLVVSYLDKLIATPVTDRTKLRRCISLMDITAYSTLPSFNISSLTINIDKNLYIKNYTQS